MTPPTPKYIEHDGKFFRRHRGAWQFTTNPEGGIWHYSVESDYEAWLDKVEFLAAERDAAESLVSAQHDVLVALRNERDWWEHRAEVAERENGEALAMLAFTGETSLWQAAAATRAKLDEAVQKARYESDVAAQAMAAKDAAERERDEAKQRARRACQTIVEAIGAPQPTDVDEAATRIVAVLTMTRQEYAKLRAKLDAAEKDSARLDVLEKHRPHVSYERRMDETVKPDRVVFGGSPWMASIDPWHASAETLDKQPRTWRDAIDQLAALDHARTAATAQGE
jgi:hypothetical protein